MNVFGAVFDVLTRWRTMREFHTLTKADLAGSDFMFKDMITEAHEAFERDLRNRSAEIWIQAYSKFPDLAMTSTSAFDLLLKLQLYSDAEQLMNRGLKKFRNGIHFLEGLATLAYKRGDWVAATEQSAILRKIHPSSLKGYWIAAASYSEMGRADEAETILARGLTMRPDDVGLRIEYARLAERREDWPVALDRWTDVLHTYGHLAGAVGRASVLTRQSRYDEADSVLASVIHKAGTQIGVWIQFAHIAEAKQDWTNASERWNSLRKRFPLDPIAYLRGVVPLDKLGRHEEAEKILLEGMGQIPYDPTLAIEYALRAHRRDDWETAVNRWSLLRERFPDCPEGYEHGRHALEALGRIGEAAAL
jgi:tetratricopeptide (TPR) repeat protein